MIFEKSSLEIIPYPGGNLQKILDLTPKSLALITGTIFIILHKKGI